MIQLSENVGKNKEDMIHAHCFCMPDADQTIKPPDCVFCKDAEKFCHCGVFGNKKHD